MNGRSVERRRAYVARFNAGVVPFCFPAVTCAGSVGQNLILTALRVTRRCLDQARRICAGLRTVGECTRCSGCCTASRTVRSFIITGGTRSSCATRHSRGDKMIKSPRGWRHMGRERNIRELRRDRYGLIEPINNRMT